jgi:hypothetical protein
VRVTPADAQERTQVAELAVAVQEATGDAVELAYVDQGYTGADPALDAADHGIRLEVVRLEEAKRGFVLLLPALGGRAQLRLGDAVSPPRQGPRAAAGDGGGAPLRGVRVPHAAPVRPLGVYFSV